MSGIKVSVSGLSELEARLSEKSINKALIPGINGSLLKIHNYLSFEIAKDYTFRNPLKSVLKPNFSSNTKQVSAIAAAGALEYEFKPVRLVNFRFKILTVPAISAFRFSPAEGKVFRVGKTTAEAVQVMVKRSSGYKTVVGRGFGGYCQKADRSGRDKYLQREKPISNFSNIYERLGASTWTGADLSAGRSPVRVLFGPSLSQAASKLVDTPAFRNKILTGVEADLAAALDKL